MRRRVEQLLARRAILQRDLRRLLRRVLQHDDELAVELARLGRFGRGGDVGLAETIELLLVVEDERGRVVRREQLGLEFGRELGFFLVELAQRDLVGIVEQRAGAHEVLVVALDEALLLRILESVAGVVQRLHAREEFRIQRDLVLVRGELGCELGLQLLDVVVGVRLREVEEHLGDARQQHAGFFGLLDRVVERRLGRIVGDRLHLGEMHAHAFLERGRVIGHLDLVERRRVERQRRFGRERIARRQLAAARRRRRRQQR